MATTCVTLFQVSQKNVEIVIYNVVQNLSSDENTATPRAYSGDVCNAIFKSIDIHDVDVLNISLGVDHSNEGHECEAYRQPCKLRQSARDATSAGIHVCAAMGNETNSSGIVCPANGKEVISVGAVDPVCTASVDQSDPVTEGTSTKPPMACWMEFNDRKNTPVICASNDCSPLQSHSCNSCREINVWDGNAPSGSDTADIYAPHRIVQAHWGDTPTLLSGTSWAAPIVTAAVVEVLAGLKSVGVCPKPEKLKQQVTRAASVVEDSGEGVLDFDSIQTIMSNEFNLQIQRESTGEELYRDW